MAEWLPCGKSFIQADVIRWTEGVWERPRRGRGRAVYVGERLVTAEVLEDTGGWLELLIRGCKVVSEEAGRAPSVLAKDLKVRRRRRTVERGKPERLLWSDESVRASLVSKFSGRR